MCALSLVCDAGTRRTGVFRRLPCLPSGSVGCGCGRSGTGDQWRGSARLDGRLGGSLGSSARLRRLGSSAAALGSSARLGDSARLPAARLSGVCRATTGLAETGRVSEPGAAPPPSLATLPPALLVAFGGLVSQGRTPVSGGARCSVKNTPGFLRTCFPAPPKSTPWYVLGTLAPLPTWRLLPSS